VTERAGPIAEPGTSEQAAVPIPVGTVTLLFTDIEGSTRLLDRLRGEYAQVLEDQRELLRTLFERWQGHEVDTQGDSFFAAFPSAQQAVCCAAEAQRALAAHVWPRGVTVRVRMGLHTGEPVVATTGYVGMDVHRAARVGAAGHGGQVLLTQTTRDLVADELPADTSLRDLGEHRLKDLRWPLRIFQLDIEGLPSDFPDIRTMAADAEPPTPGEAPYRGLQPFDGGDARLFFGREATTTRLVDALAAWPLLAIVGASGSGKSSILRAGLIPAMQGDGRGDWQTHLLTPGAHPLDSLAMSLGSDPSAASAALLIDDFRRDPRSLRLHINRMLAGTPDPRGGRRKRGGRVLVAIDQFEEVFTQCRDEGERRAFIDNLLTAVDLAAPFGPGAVVPAAPTTTATDGPAIRVAITLRADFYTHVARYDALRDAIAAHQVYIGSMDADGLRRAIEEPAARNGWDLVPGLSDLMLHDAGEEPGALPLLSHALLETWRRRRGTTLTLQGYAVSGGVRGAIAATADRVYLRELSDDQRRMARSIFLRLTELGEGTQDTRRRVPRSELVPEDDNVRAVEIEHVLGILADARLITMGDDTVEVAHEALIREWPTLREWLGQDREGLRLHRRLTDAAAEWEIADRDPGSLYRGARLAQAVEWAASRSAELNAGEHAFLEAGREQADAEQYEREATQQRELAAAHALASAESRRAQEAAGSARRLRRRALLLAAVGVVAVVLAGFAVVARQDAASSFANAESQRLGAEANVSLFRGESAELAALLAIRGIESQYTPQADGALQRASRSQFSDRILSFPPEADGITTPLTRVIGVDVSRDGRSLLVAVDDGNSYVMDLEHGGGPVYTLPSDTGLANGAMFSPDGSVAATLDAGPGARLHVWDMATGKERWSAPVSQGGAGLSFSGDSRVLATVQPDSVSLLDVSDGSIVSQVKKADNVLMAPDGATAYIVTEGVGGLWDLPSGTHLRDLSGPDTVSVKAAAFSPDGRLLATTALDHTIRLWDVASGMPVRTLTGHTEIVFQPIFSPDGLTLLSGSLDGTARLWDVATGATLRTFVGHTASVYSNAFTPDGRFAVTGGKDGTVRFWDITAPAERDTLLGATSFMYGMAWSPDGKQLFAGNADGTAQIWDVATQTVTHVLRTDQRIDSAAFSPDGSLLVTGPGDGPSVLWDPATGVQIGELQGSGGGNNMASFSADGRSVVGPLAPLTDGGPPAVGIWDVATRQLVQRVDTDDYSGGALSPDGSLLFTYEDSAVLPNGTIWDVATGEKLRTVGEVGGIIDGTFSPDGTTILTVGRDDVGHLWDAPTGMQLQELRGHTNIMWRGTFSPDGRYVFTTSQDKSARMWDARTGQQVRYFPGHALSAVAGVAVSPDGREIAIGSYDGAIQLTPTSGAALISKVCSRLRRDLTAVERTIYDITDPAATCRGG
jgi:WD40 repeat protein/class 3 adenylate cyclase